MIICARTDALQEEGVEGVINRSLKYIDSGADMIFPEGLRTVEEFKEVGDHLKHKTYLLGNVTEFGVSPLLSVGDLQRLGFSVALFPVSTLRVSMFAVDLLVNKIKEEGTQKGAVGSMQTRQQLYELLGYKHSEDWLY